MAATIEVRIAGRGVVRDGQKTAELATRAHCDLCATDVDAVASVTAAAGGPFACKECLRQRLEAMTVATWMMREPERAAAGGLPWGKVSG